MQLNRPFATVTPTLDGDVLTILATHDVTFTTGQIHRILDDFSEEGIRKVLTRLVLQGVVLADQVGNAFTYRLNTQHLAAEPIKALARLTSTFFTRLEQHLDAWPEPPAYAAIFGSAVMGRMTLHSDVDILLVRGRDATESTWSHHVGELTTAVTGWTGNDARVVDYTIDELRRSATEPMVRDVVDHGLTVAGSRAWLVKQLRAIPNEDRS
jgi:predicted nucleotidyltransferase